ncbi:hypothetical protein AWC29_20605 [Mycobacterium triplex]|uniref:DUF4239 domain-containing protein n=2 Tax=Mycobacterium triplex TaxID=47839 RepID=A0ABX3W1S7_9MYCO|nr:DUF4239 domain-containing protein [Mycobacterium triplex]ORX02246.1 hypothetical protein AWC29_20605 [Mycobacterium triplex]
MDGLGLPLWLLLLCVVGGAILIAVGCIVFANRTMKQVGQDHNSTMSPFIAIVGLVYGALLGFTVVVAWQQFSSAEVVAANEASALTTMYRQTVAMPEPERSQLRQLLRSYASAVASSESTTRSGDAPSDTARSAITTMYRIVGTQPTGTASSPINAEYLSELSTLAADRTQRIIDTEPRIPPLLWAGLIFGGIVLVGLTAFLSMQSTVGHAVVTSTIAVLLGLLLCIVFTLDHPFETDRGITAEPFQHALEVFDAVDHET